MISRYSIMSPSLTQVDTDNQLWPDPLSIDYGSFKYSQPPYIVEPDDRFNLFPYLITYSFYSRAEYDDIVLSINNIPHISLVMKTKAYAPWSSTTLYFENSIVSYNNNVYISLSTNNMGNNPLTEISFWSLIDSTSIYSSLKFPVIADLNEFMKKGI